MLKTELGDFEAFAFDFDGTLANTVPTHTAARLEAFKRMAEETADSRFIGISTALQAEAHRYGTNPTAIIGWVLQEAGIVKDSTDSLIGRTVEMKKNVYKELATFGQEEMPGATDFVKGLLEIVPQRVAIVTTAHKDAEVLPFLRRYRLEDSFSVDRLVTFEDVGPDHLKPDPRAYEIILERFNLTQTPERLLVVEDTWGGVEAAKAIGATVVAIATTHTREELEAIKVGYQPDFVVDNFKQLSEMCGIL